MNKMALIVGIVGGMVLTSIYAIVHTESANPKVRATPDSDKKSGPGPNDSTIGSDANPTNRRASSKGKKQRSGFHKKKSQSPVTTRQRTNLGA